MKTALILLVVTVLISGISSAPKSKLNDALDSILGHLRENDDGTAYPALRKRCSGRVACENPTVAVEAEKVVFVNGTLYVSSDGPQVQDLMKQLGKLPGALANRLPSIQTQSGGKVAWMAGPEVKVSPQYQHQCDWSTVPKTHAFLHIPWETNNAFHTLNDNLLSVLSDIIVQYLTSPRVSPQDTLQYVLYRLNPVGRGGAGAPSLLNNLFPVIFGAGNIKPAKMLLTGGPHCVRRLSWAAAPKPFYKDTLLDLRQAAYEVLHHIMHAYMRDTATTAVQHSPLLSSTTGVRAHVTAGKRVVIVTRNNTHADPLRRLHPKSELQLQQSLQALGYSVEICCNFTLVNTMPKVLEHFLDIDVCIGIHGAGMTNCVFGRPGMIYVELQTFHGYGVLSFPKLAHMAGGDYIGHDLRGLRKIPGKSHAGIVLPDVFLHKIAQSLSRVHSLRQKYPAANGMHTGTSRLTAATRTAESQQSDALRGIRIIAVDAKRKHAFVLPTSNTSTVSTTLKGFDGYAVKHLKAHLESAEYTLDKTEHLAVFLKKFQRLSVARNNGTYWIAPYPTRASPAYTRDSILGPESSKAFTVCMSTVYHELRVLCFPPQDREVLQCDSPPAPKKRMATKDVVLGREFYN